MFLVITLLLIKCLYLEGKLFGDHVCQIEITEPREVLQWELKNRTVRTYKWCMNVPPRCSVYSQKVFNETKSSVINITKSLETCCEGFHEHNNYCISMCQNCKNGLCLKGTCICQYGWDGPNCDSRVLDASEEIIFTTKAPTSSITNLEDSLTVQTPTGLQSNNSFEDTTSTRRQHPNNYHHGTFLEKNVITFGPTTLPSNTEDLKENAISSTDTSLYSSSATVTADFNTTAVISYGENILNQSNEETYDITSLKNSLEYSKEYVSLNFSISTKRYESKSLEETLAGSTDNIFLDTTVTQQTVESSTVFVSKIKTVSFNSKESSQDDINKKLDSNHSDGIATTITSPKFTIIFQQETVNNFTNIMLESPDSDVDYRELGGPSFEEKSVASPKVLQNGVDKNILHLNVLEARNNSARKNFESNIEKTTTQNILENIVPVLDKPNILKDEKKNSISKEEDLGDLAEERYQKRSFDKNYSQNTLLTKNEPDNHNLIYSVCAASATTVLILIVAIIVFTFKNARKKIDKKGKKNVATVAVYTTSIFHTPLPDPPTFENPTYLSTGGGNESWKDQNEEMIEVQEFNVVFQKPIKNPQLDCKQYLYDHPPSTGSYRASSDVDTLSQYNLSHKSLSGIILEPVYDEIPSRDNPEEDNNEHDTVNRRSIADASKNNLNYLDNNSLYVNTFGRTMF